ncbi:MAG: Gfo/Idh/MocA family oxidoreductase [Paracoccaceae bacterium]
MREKAAGAMAVKFGVGIVGAGMAAAPHMRALEDLSDSIEVRGVWTRSAESREKFAAASGFPAVGALDDLLGDTKIDALIVLTPPNARHEVVERAARAGKHILMEKPIERTAEAAERIVAICEAAGVRLGVVFQNRFRASSLALRALLDKGDLGEICSVSLSVPWWRPQSYYDEPGRGTLARDGGGVLITQGIHALDLMLSMTGPATEAQAMVGATMHRMEAEDFAAGALRLASGALGAVMATVTSHPGGQDVLTLNCRNGVARLAGGALRVDWLDGRAEDIGDDAQSGHGADPMAFSHEWHRAQIAEFVEAVRAGRAPASNGRTALDVHRLIDAMIRSSASGRREAVG